MKDQERQGYEDGQAAGTWVFGGNTPRETYAAILRGIEDGDPETLDMLPQPPADSSEDYAYAYAAGVEAEVIRAATYQLEGEA